MADKVDGLVVIAKEIKSRCYAIVSFSIISHNFPTRVDSMRVAHNRRRAVSRNNLEVFETVSS